MHEYAHWGVLSFNKPLLSVYYVPGTMLAQSLCLKTFTISWEFRQVHTEFQHVGINANRPVQKALETLKSAGRETFFSTFFLKTQGHVKILF